MRKLFSGFIIQFLVLEIIYRYSIIENMDPNQEDPKEDITGGRKKTRKENPVLKSWRKFVRKVQHEEKITYPQAMKRASKRKSEWQRGGDGEEEEEGEDTSMSNPYSPPMSGGEASIAATAASVGGSRRRRGSSKKRRASRKRRGSRRR